MNINAIHESDRGTDSLEILDLPADVLVLVFSLLCGQDIARCKRVCHYFLDVILLHLHLQYAIDLAQNGMVDGEFSILPLSERLQRLRQYSSNFRNGIFYREGSAAHPDYWRRLHQFSWMTSMEASDSSTILYESPNQEVSHQLLSVFTPGSAQAGIPSRRLLTPVGSPVEEGRPRPRVRVWAVDCVLDLLAVCEVVIPAFTSGERIVIHFHSLSRSKTVSAAHPAAAVPSMQVWPLGDPFSLAMESTGSPISLFVSGDHVIWQIMNIGNGSEWSYSIGMCNWRTGEIIRLYTDVGRRPVHVVPLNKPYLFMTMGDHKLKTLDIFSFFPSVSDPLICKLQLPDLGPGETLGLWHLVASQLPQTREGHFYPDPEHRIIALTRNIRRPECTYTSVLLVPCAALHAHAYAAMSAKSVRARSDSGARPPVPVVPWRDWGPRVCLHLRVPVCPNKAVSRSIILIPYSSRMPLVVFDGANPNCASIYVVDINPLAARYARGIRVSATDGTDRSQGAMAIVAPEDTERVLPGVVDPECSSIPYALYRFELPVSPTEWPAGHIIRRVQMNTTGFTVTFDGVGFEEMAQTWAI